VEELVDACLGAGVSRHADHTTPRGDVVLDEWCTPLGQQVIECHGCA
jgi:hypothetical protein